MPAMPEQPLQSSRETKPKAFLPPINSPGYYVLLAAVAIFILGPLGGITAAYMNFSLGFFVGGQVLAGILGSVVTYGYGAEGKHGANYMQTMAASVATMSGMAVLIQAMVWLKMPQPPTWQLILFFVCVGMFGVGVGMLYTPILVDKMQLSFPSGFAVANILRALTDKVLLKRSVAKLGGGAAAGFIGGFMAAKLALLKCVGVSDQTIKGFDSLGLNTSTVGAGMVVGARIAIPGLVVGLIGDWMMPYFREIGWLGPQDPFRRIGFMIALGTILGAAIVDLILIGISAARQYKAKKSEAPKPSEDWKKTNTRLLIVWVLFWAVALVLTASSILHQPIGFVAFSVALVFIFLMINGIADGVSDQNPISSAFVIAVLLMALLGLKDAGTGLMCASVLLIACAVGVDMQQDRSTGWRLGTNRKIQFRFQVIGIFMGSIMAVVLAKLFMKSYPILQVNTLAEHVDGAKQWQSAMTYKFLGALDSLTHPKPFVIKAMLIGVLIGVATEVIRKVVKNWKKYQEFSKGSRTGKTADFVFDSVVMPSPYASSFGGFVELSTTVWFALGGVAGSLMTEYQSWQSKKHPQSAGDAIPEDMSSNSLIGGGIIAGDALASLSIGIYGLLNQLHLS